MEDAEYNNMGLLMLRIRVRSIDSESLDQTFTAILAYLTS